MPDLGENVLHDSGLAAILLGADLNAIA
ncbi:MAG: hypothetical protein H6Q33_5456, partial [Deltaproteobacteria bacterium]|nr:hypothetical protein [Deltaproteobacteria bacterium]